MTTKNPVNNDVSNDSLTQQYAYNIFECGAQSSTTSL